MSYVFVAPEIVATAATDLTGVGSAVSAANASAASATTQVMVAAGDEVSAATAALFGAYGQEYQAMSTRLAALHDQFMRTLTASANSYAAAEAANASSLAGLTDLFSPWQALTGRPLSVTALTRRLRAAAAGRPAGCTATAATAPPAAPVRTVARAARAAPAAIPAAPASPIRAPRWGPADPVARAALADPRSAYLTASR
jgi:hypothetical protein